MVNQQHKGRKRVDINFLFWEVGLRYAAATLDCGTVADFQWSQSVTIETDSSRLMRFPYPATSDTTTGPVTTKEWVLRSVLRDELPQLRQEFERELEVQLFVLIVETAHEYFEHPLGPGVILG